jgi:hypothetical protein
LSYVFNIAKGRVSEYFDRVDANEPANSAIVVIPLKVTDTEANRQDDATVEAFLAALPDEQTEGWSRKTLTDADLAGAQYAPDNTNNRGQASLPEIKWTAPTSGKNVVALLVAYDADTTGGTDANLIPLLVLDFAVTADGNDVALNAGEVFRAS